MGFGCRGVVISLGYGEVTSRNCREPCGEGLGLFVWNKLGTSGKPECDKIAAPLSETAEMRILIRNGNGKPQASYYTPNRNPSVQGFAHDPGGCKSMAPNLADVPDSDPSIRSRTGLFTH